MSWETLFSGYNCRDGIAELRQSYYFHRPDKLESPAEVAQEDGRVAATIQEMQGRIAALQSYRAALQQRYASLATKARHQAGFFISELSGAISVSTPVSTLHLKLYYTCKIYNTNVHANMLKIVLKANIWQE